MLQEVSCISEVRYAQGMYEALTYLREILGYLVYFFEVIVITSTHLYTGVASITVALAAKMYG